MNHYITILGKATKSTFSKNSWNWLLGGFGSLNALLLLGKNFFDLKVPQSIILCGAIIFTLIFIRFSLVFFRLLFSHWFYFYKESIYGKCIILLKDAFSKIHFLRKYPSTPDEAFTESLNYICQQLKEHFDRKTKASCGVSIKVPTDGSSISSADAIVKNLSRDNFSVVRDTELYKKEKHYIFKNDCYNHIFTNFTEKKWEQLFYIHHDIPSDKSYKNTSKKAKPDGKLDYKSELVVPLFPLFFNEKESIPEIIGFLCIDCINTNAFDTNYDLAVIQGVADGIYDIIQLRLN